MEMIEENIREVDLKGIDSPEELAGCLRALLEISRVLDAAVSAQRDRLDRLELDSAATCRVVRHLVEQVAGHAGPLEIKGPYAQQAEMMRQAEATKAPDTLKKED